MKSVFKWFIVILAIFFIGGLSSLFVNYIIFSKLVHSEKWSENKIIKAFSDRVSVFENTEKVIVKDNESLSDISSKVSAGVVYIEEILPSTSSRIPSGGSGIIMSSDGIIVFHNSVFSDESISNYLITFFDGTKKEAKKIYKDDYTGIVFLQVEMNNLTTMPFVNSADMIGGKKLINIYREKNSNQVFYNLGILSGFDYDFEIKNPSCDYLQGVFRVDFNEKALENGLGSPMIDFNGQMVGLLVKKNYESFLNVTSIDAKKESVLKIIKNEYFVITSNDIKDSFDRFLKQSSNLSKENIVLNSENNKVFLNANCDYKNYFIENENVEGNEIYFIENKNKKFPVNSIVGLENYDLILQVNDEKVSLKNPLSKILLNYKKGDKASINLKRKGKEVKIEVTF